VPNLTEAQLRRYLTAYHAAYRATSERFFKPEHLRELGRYPLLEYGIHGYVSTQFGAGFEYLPAPAVGITTEHHSSRVEYLFTRAPRALRDIGPMIAVQGSNIAIQGLTLEGAFPFLLAGRDTDIRLIDVRFKAGDWTRDVLRAELFGDRRADNWTEARAVARANDELFLAYAQVKSAAALNLSIADYVTRFKERHVLVLGDYSPAGRTRLEGMKQILSEANYEPVLLDELPDYPGMNLQQKAVTYGSVCRFIVIDDSSKSGHQVEAVHVQLNNWIAIVLRLEGSDATSFMGRGVSALSTVIHEVTFREDNLSDVMGGAIAWAEAQNSRLQHHWSATYPWLSERPGP